MFEPRFTLTARTVKALVAIETDRQRVQALPLSVRMLDSLRRTARLLSTHLSTWIEGNQLTPHQVQVVVEGKGQVPGRERDAAEVRNYFVALTAVEKWGRGSGRLTEREIRTIHGLVMIGKPRATPYRDGQNMIRDSRTGGIVYLPPEAKDVPGLMQELVRWVNHTLAQGELPIPVAAALTHHQFATIHPYFDGNGRTARLLTTLVLHRTGFALHGIYSLEEHYAANLEGYYTGLSVGKSHNYYFGRKEADVSAFVEYFCIGMAEAFAKVRASAEKRGQRESPVQTGLIRELSPEQRQALSVFLNARIVASKDFTTFFRITPRQALSLCVRWVQDGFLAVENPSTKARSYRLADKYESLVATRGTRRKALPRQTKAVGTKRGGKKG